MKPFSIIIMIATFFACVEKMQLPDSLDNNTKFAAGDTTYLLIQPVWDESMGLQSPLEISIAQDGHVFVADIGAKSILAFSQNGELLAGFEELQNLSITPIDVDIDQKMNVYFTDGSQKIYVWNQYLNEVGVEEIAISGSFYNEGAGSVTIDAFSEEWTEYLTAEEWTLVDVNWSSPQKELDTFYAEYNLSPSILDTVVDFLLDIALFDEHLIEGIIDSLIAEDTDDSLFTRDFIDLLLIKYFFGYVLVPHIFYNGADPIHSFNDIYYESESSSFSGLTATRDKNNFMYALDYPHDRIIRIDLQRTHLLKLNNGEEIWTHRGIFAHTVTDKGTGAGTVDNPTGIDVDYNGNIYYSQTGEYFTVHKIRKASGSNDYLSIFDNGINEIMDLFRFPNPADVAVDNNQFVYVSNSEEQEIQVFDSDGQFFLKAGVETFTVDTTLHVFNGTDTVAVDTFVTIEEKGFLVEPHGVTVDSRGIIYICDTPTGRILRYRLSNQLDEDLQPFQ